MKAIIFAVPLAALALSACVNGRLQTPSSIVTGNPGLSARLDDFCSSDFETGNTAAVTEWVMAYNLFAPIINRDPIPTEDLTQREAVQKLMQVRSAVCVATAPVPAPAVEEAVEEVEVAQ